MDKFSKSKRSEIMSKIRSSNTKFEENFIYDLKKKTRKQFKRNVKDIRGMPDIVFEKERLCIFLDSDFWHGWQFSRWKESLKNDFWKNKIENTRKRDRKTTAYLRKSGWKVIRIWEHQLKKKNDEMIAKIISNL